MALCSALLKVKNLIGWRKCCPAPHTDRLRHAQCLGHVPQAAGTEGNVTCEVGPGGYLIWSFLSARAIRR